MKLNTYVGTIRGTLTSLFVDAATAINDLLITKPETKKPHDVLVKMSDVRALREKAEKLSARLNYVGAYAFIHLDAKTATHARIIDYDPEAEVVTYVHEDCYYNTDVDTNLLKKHNVESVECHYDPHLDGGVVCYHFWIKDYVPPTD